MEAEEVPAAVVNSVAGAEQQTRCAHISTLTKNNLVTQMLCSRYQFETLAKQKVRTDMSATAYTTFTSQDKQLLLWEDMPDAESDVNIGK